MMPKERPIALAALILFLVVGIIVHKDALKTPLFWDDEATILSNVFIKDIRFLPQLFTSGYHAGSGEITSLYRPITNLSFLIEYHLFKTNSLGYHVTNLCLHILNTFLIFLLVGQFFKEKAVAMAGALLFLVHPVVTEVVNYASHRAELLMTLSLLLSFLCYIRYHKENKPLLLAVSLGLFVVSILAKEMGLILPLFLLLYHRSTGLKDYRRLLAFGLIALAYVLLRATALNFLDVNIVTQGAQASPYSKNIVERFLVFAKIFFVYLRILFLPLDLHMDRDIPFLESQFETGAVLKALLIIALIAGLIKDRRRGYSFWAGWFLLGLVPVSGIIPINTAIAEHYLYMPSIGFFTAASWLIWQLALRLKTKAWQGCLAGAVVTLIIALSLLTTARNKEWNTPLTLYLTTVNNTQDSFRANNNAGVEYFRKGSLQTAEYYFKESLAILPTYAPALNNMGVIAQRKGKTAEAIDLYKKAIEYDRDYLLAYRNLYSLYLKLKRVSDAEDVLEDLLDVFPYDEAAKNALTKIRSRNVR